MNQATREVICGDAVKWLQELEVLPGSVITGIPDYSEVGLSVEEWKVWFMNVCSLIFKKLAENECAIFCQTDVKIPYKEGDKQYAEWVDKSYLCQRACEGSDCKLIFHKIISFSEEINNKNRLYVYYGKLTGYSHMLCFRKRDKTYIETLPDVLFRGDQVWEKGSGFNSTLLAIKYCKQIGSKCIVDPFCGKGSVLAVANYLGMNAVGVEIKAKLCKNAMNLRIDENERNAFVWQEKEKEKEKEKKKETHENKEEDEKQVLDQKEKEKEKENEKEKEKE